MSRTNSGPAAKFEAGDAVLDGADKKKRTVITIIEPGEYHSEYRDRPYLARSPENTLITVWESEAALVASRGKQDTEGSNWQSKSLWRQYEKVVAKREPINQWLEEEKKKLDEAIMATTANGYWPFGMVLFVLSLIVCGFTLLITSGGWHWIGSCFVASCVTGLFFWVKWGIGDHIRTKALKEAKRKERTQDPLWQRAELILKAVDEFKLHRDHYRAWQTAVDEGLQDGDQNLAERYYAFLTRASVGINASINNFTRAAELTKRQMKYREQHPELAEAAVSTHLGDLMAQLNCPVEIPAAITLMDPRRALEHEEALGEAVRLLYDSELHIQIEEVLQENKEESLPVVPAES